MSIRVLCLADLHLGRVIARHASSSASPEEAWQRAVAWAQQESIDLVLLAGDMVDRDDDLFEGAASLERGLYALLQAGIRVAAVSGNHDPALFQRMRRRLRHPLLHLLGDGVLWESASFVLQGLSVRCDGWSFPSKHYPTSPLDTYSLPPPAPGELVLGLLHCDAADGGSPYAPIAVGALRSLPPAGWVLGHIHEKQVVCEAPYAVYPGSAQGLDPSEQGAHGGVLLECTGEGIVRTSWVPLASLEYATVSVSCEGHPSAESALEGALPRWAGALALSPVATTVGLTLRWEGRAPFFASLKADLATWVGRELPPITSEGREITYFITGHQIEALPDWDVAKLAEGTAPPAILAALLLALQEGGGVAEELIMRARERLLLAKTQKAPFQEIGESEVDGDTVRRLLLQSGLQTLDHWLSRS